MFDFASPARSFAQLHRLGLRRPPSVFATTLSTGLLVAVTGCGGDGDKAPILAATCVADGFCEPSCAADPDCVGSGSGGSDGSGGATGGTATGGALGGGAGPGEAAPEGLVFACEHGFGAAAVTEEMLLAEYASWQTKYLEECSDGSTRVIEPTGSPANRTVSEGIAYGMLIATAFGDRALFDRLWAFYDLRKDDKGLLPWEWSDCNTQTARATSAALDADIDAALGLVFADRRWGGYGDAAQGMINAVGSWGNGTCTEGDSYLYALVPWPYGECSMLNPSYFSPGHYHVFSQYLPGSASYWDKVAADSYVMLERWQDADPLDRGLVPDWGSSTGEWVREGQSTWDACRAPWRVALDLIWFDTPEARTYLERVGAYVESQGGPGTTQADTASRASAFLGAFALTAQAMSQEKLDSYVDHWLTYASDGRYFQDTLKLLYLLAAGCAFPSLTE